MLIDKIAQSRGVMMTIDW